MAQKKRIHFKRWKNEISWKKWLSGEVSNYQKQMEIHYIT